MAKAKQTDTDDSRKTTRPVLIASRRTVAEYTTCLHRLLVGLADESITTALIAPPDCGLEGIAPIPSDVLTHPPIDLPFMEQVGIERLAERLEKFRPTVLHSLCENRAALTARLAERLDVPYVLTVNTLITRHVGLSVSPTHCAAVIVPSQTILSSAVRSHFRFADRIRQIHLGTFAGSEPVCFADPARLTNILVAHPLDRVSHFETLFQATRQLIGDGHEFMLTIMGRGRAEHRLRRLLAEYRLSDVVVLVPPLDPWRAVLAAGDIFVQPRPNAAFSALLLEAMGLGAAVVACAGGVDDLIVPNQTTLVFDPHSAESLREHLARLLGDREFSRRLAAMAQSYVRDRYSVGGMVAATLEVYGEAQRRCAQAVG